MGMYRQLGDEMLEEIEAESAQAHSSSADRVRQLVEKFELITPNDYVTMSEEDFHRLTVLWGALGSRLESFGLCHRNVD